MKATEKGWVILSEDGNIIYDFTFSHTRTDAQRKWVKLWDNPDNWKAHYRKGFRCVKAEMILTIEV